MAQKSHFKALKTGTYIKRHTFPQLPFAELDKPKTFKTQAGDLLVDGLWAYLRKPSESPALAVVRVCLVRCIGTSTSSTSWLTCSLPSRRLHRRLDPGPDLGCECRDALAHPVLLPRVPLHNAPAPQLARRRKVRAQVRRRLEEVQGARAVLVRPAPLPSATNDERTTTDTGVRGPQVHPVRVLRVALGPLRMREQPCNILSRQLAVLHRPPLSIPLARRPPALIALRCYHERRTLQTCPPRERRQIVRHVGRGAARSARSSRDRPRLARLSLTHRLTAPRAVHAALSPDSAQQQHRHPLLALVGRLCPRLGLHRSPGSSDLYPRPRPALWAPLPRSRRLATRLAR